MDTKVVEDSTTTEEEQPQESPYQLRSSSTQIRHQLLSDSPLSPLTLDSSMPPKPPKTKQGAGARKRPAQPSDDARSPPRSKKSKTTTLAALRHSPRIKNTDEGGVAADGAGGGRGQGADPAELDNLQLDLEKAEEDELDDREDTTAPRTSTSRQLSMNLSAVDEEEQQDDEDKQDQDDDSSDEEEERGAGDDDEEEEEDKEEDVDEEDDSEDDEDIEMLTPAQVKRAAAKAAAEVKKAKRTATQIKKAAAAAKKSAKAAKAAAEKAKTDKANAEAAAGTLANERGDDFLAFIQLEKDIVDGSFIDKPKSLTSKVWSKVNFMDIDKILKRYDKLEDEEKLNMSGIQKLQQYVRGDKNKKNNTIPICCALCFDDPSVPLSRAIVKLVLKKEKKDKGAGPPPPQMGNFQSHCRSRDDKHKAFLDGATGKGNNSSAASVAASGGATTVAGPSGTTTVVVPHHAYTEWAQLPKAQIIARMHQLMYTLVNDANIPVHIIRNQRLWDLVEFIVRNSHPLRNTPRSTLTMGRYKFNSIQAVNFGTMVNTIERLVNDARQHLSKSAGGRTVPFIYIGHDIWDGKSKSVLGLCIFFVSPLLKQLVKLPVAILRSEGHTSDQVAQQSLEALKR